MTESSHEKAAAGSPAGASALPGERQPDSPSLSMLRNCWAAYLDEQATEEDVLGVLDTVQGFIQFELDTLQQQVEQGISQLENPTFQKIFGAFERHLEGLDRIALEFDPEVTELEVGSYFQEGYQICLEATGDLIDAHQQTMEHIEAMANVSCIFCSHSNPRESERCSQCGRNLPGSPSGSSFSLVNAEGLEGPVGSGLEVTGNYAKVAQAVEGWRQAQIDSDQLLAVLDEVEGKLAGHRQETEQYYREIASSPEAAREALEQAVAQTELGLDQSLDALETMKLAFDKEDDSYLVTGLDQLEQASNLLVQAYHASRQAAQKART